MIPRLVAGFVRAPVISNLRRAGLHAWSLPHQLSFHPAAFPQVPGIGTHCFLGPQHGVLARFPTIPPNQAKKHPPMKMVRGALS